jgi:hypothetical protein
MMLLSMFVTMVLIQVFVMPYVMVARAADVYFSVTQGYMGAFMGAAMLAVEGLLWHPLPWWGWLLTIAIGVGAVVGYRTQFGIGDREYMHDMIPHHSMAVLTSRYRVDSQNPRVARLAEDILVAQEREIEQMRFMLKSYEQAPKQ